MEQRVILIEHREHFYPSRGQIAKILQCCLTNLEFSLRHGDTCRYLFNASREGEIELIGPVHRDAKNISDLLQQAIYWNSDDSSELHYMLYSPYQVEIIESGDNHPVLNEINFDVLKY